jgi:L-asparaginase II
MQTFDVDVVATRGERVESRHRVHAAVVDASGRLVAAAGDPSLTTFWRSCAKPFQVMKFVETGGFDEVGWGDDELTLACASHGGEPEHVSIAESMLGDLGLEEGDLACGPHDPLSARVARIVRESGIRPTRLHNNCSGKHAAMLAYARTAGWATEGYERLAHEVQQSSLREVSRWSGVPARSIPTAVDGCGVVVFALPLERMAAAYAQLSGAVSRGEEVPARIVDAIRTRPFLFGGTDRFDSVLLEETEGRIVPKVGAEGVHSALVPALGLGMAVKVEDGSQRAQYPALLRLLQRVGALPEQLPARLEEFLRRPLRNSRGEVVGEVVPRS